MSQHIIWRLPQTLAVTGLTKSTLYRLARLGKFPKPVKLSERASGWKRSDVEAWINSRETA